MNINNPDRFLYILIDLCLGNMSLLEITPAKLSNFYFPIFDHLICAYFRFLSLTDMIHIPWVLATWQELLLSRICVSPNPSNRNIHTNPFIKSGPTHTSVSTCIYLYIYLDTIRKRKHVSETARGSWACLQSFIICAEGDWSPGKRTQTDSPSPDHPPTFGLVVFCILSWRTLPWHPAGLSWFLCTCRCFSHPFVSFLMSLIKFLSTLVQSLGWPPSFSVVSKSLSVAQDLSMSLEASLSENHLYPYSQLNLYEHSTSQLSIPFLCHWPYFTDWSKDILF